MTGRRWTAAALVSVAVVIALLSSGSALAAPTPSPSPDDRATRLSVTPTSLTARQVLTLRGFSDCAVVDGHLLFVGYDDNPDNVVVRSAQATRYDTAREKFPYEVRITVPARARPGAARVYAEPFCGPPEEYPPSTSQDIRIEPASLTLSKSLRRPVEGDRLRLSARTCNGLGRRLTFAVTVAGLTTQISGEVSADGRASVSYVLPLRPGPATVRLPLAARECPGSSAPANLDFRIRAARANVPVVVSSAPASLTASPGPIASTARVSASPPTTDTQLTRAARRSKGRGPVLVLIVAAATVVLGGGAAGWRGRRRRAKSRLT